MSFKDFKIVETIGKGSFASVYKVIRRSDNKVYALKRVKISKMSKKEISDALNEIRFLASIRHKNIVGFLEAFLENNESELCIIMEYCGCGDLAQKVERYKKKKQYIDEKVIWKYLIQSLKALHHLHDKGICHRDLKVANTFLAEDGSIKIGDMNVSKKIDKGQLQTQIGTPYYMSPEIWNNKPYDFRSDIWSLGCLIYELAALRPPFLGDSFPQLKRAVTLGRYSPLPGKYSDSLNRVIAQMLRLDPKLRPNASMLLQNADVLIKLSLDETSTSFSLQQQPQQQQHDNNHHNNQQQQPSSLLINTIKVPHNLNKLNQALPKPCYSDVRPNSPSSWIISDQKEQYLKNEKAVLQHQQYIQQQRKASLSALPIVPPLPLPVTTNTTDNHHHQQQQQQQHQNGKENHQPIPPPTTRSQISDYSSARSNYNHNHHHHGNKVPSTNHLSSLPTPPPTQLPVPPPLPLPTGLSAVDEYFYRRNHALAPVVITKNNNNNYTDNNSIDSNNNNHKGQHNNIHKPPSIPTYQSNNNHEPIPSSIPTDIPSTIPAVSHYDSNGHYIHRPKQPQPPTRPAAAAAVASRLQYHHRVW